MVDLDNAKLPPSLYLPQRLSCLVGSIKLNVTDSSSMYRTFYIQACIAKYNIAPAMTPELHASNTQSGAKLDFLPIPLLAPARSSAIYSSSRARPSNHKS